VNEHGDRIREALETHEHLSPDPEAVYARVRELSRTYHRRRRSAQAAGGAVLGAGLIAGAIQLPAVFGGAPTQSVAAVAPAASTPAKPTAAEMQKDWDAYFAAGLDYDDAVQLAKLWHSKDEIGLVKAEAGRRLLAGETLPVTATPAEITAAKEARETDAFFAAGYSTTDAATLAHLWHTTPYQAKVQAATMLTNHKRLPIEPTPEKDTPAQTKAQKQLHAYFAAGYDYNDAVRLSKLWHVDTDQAKAAAGKKLLAGEKLPFKP
jgi:hypothetical protein